MSLVTGIFIIFVFLFIYKFLSPSRKMVNYGEKIPGPKAYPIIGNGLCFFTKKPILQVLSDFTTTYGSIYRLWIGKQLFIFTTDPADIKVFLTATNKHLDKSDIYRFLHPWLGDTSLLTSNGDIWKIRRKQLAPFFHFKMLENSIGMITRNADILVEQMEKQLDGLDFDIELYVENCTIDIICEAGTTINLETQLLKNTVYPDCIKTICDITVTRMFRLWLHPEFTFKISTKGRLYYKSLRIIKTWDRKIIQQRKKMIEQNGNKSALEEEGRKVVQPFLDFLLTRTSLSDSEIENELQNFIFAGFDTTKTTISFVLYLLSKHEDVQNKLFEEIESTFKETDGNPSYQDYKKMKYLECVIKETLRVYSTIPFISRKVAEDVQLPSGYILPAGTILNIFMFKMHRNEHIFPDPEKFLPERFQYRELDKLTPYSYIPFSAGPRNCIGQQFAMSVMKIMISKLLLKYKFLPSKKSDPPILEIKVAISSLNQLPVQIQRRN